MTDDLPNFEGHEPRECGEHRTVGSHRAWCYDCGEWCYPQSPCARCELPALRAEVERLGGVKEQWILAEQEIDRLRAALHALRDTQHFDMLTDGILLDEDTA